MDVGNSIAGADVRSIDSRLLFCGAVENSFRAPNFHAEFIPGLANGHGFDRATAQRVQAGVAVGV